MIGYTIGHEDPVGCKISIDYSRMPPARKPVLTIDPAAFKKGE